MQQSMPRILLLMATRTYRARAFMRAARRLHARVVVGSERRQALASARPGTTVALDFGRPDRAVDQIVAFAQEYPLDAVIGVDDDTTVLAAMAAAALGLHQNDVAAVQATRDKHLMRRLLRDAGVRSPWFDLVTSGEVPQNAAARARYPCVLKPISLSASRGVIRADSSSEFVAALDRVRTIAASAQRQGSDGDGAVLVEEFIPGFEVALEAIVTDSTFNVLALFDKPDPLDGPYFEETIYVTPSRLPKELQRQITHEARRAATALGLRGGPVHAELRVNERGPWIVEIAARSIGGLCSDTLEFSGGVSLEELVLLDAVGADISTYERERQPSGVMMLPVPGGGVLRAVHGAGQARAVQGIADVTISIPIGQMVLPAPEGDRYLGFIFARGETAEEVESALRQAHRFLHFDIEPVEVSPLPVGSTGSSRPHGRSYRRQP